MKLCTRCKQEKALDAFARRGNGLQSSCKLCKREVNKAHYAANREMHYLKRDRNRAKYREWYRALKDHPCTDCGQKYHFAAMEWDHLPGFTKLANVGTLVQRGASKQRILEEISKCELVCKNCHGVRTWKRCGIV